MNSLLSYFTDNILTNPPILLGIVAAIGLITQRKNLSEIVKGSLQAAFGMLILDAGVGLIVETISPINEAFQETVASDAAVTEALSDVTFTAEFGGEVGIAMFIGLILHLLIAKFTPIKTIFLTGHMIWWFPFIFVAAGVESGLDGVALILFGAVLSALYWSIMPWIMRKYVWDVTEDDSFLIGHPTGVLSLVAGFIAKKVGDKSKSTEDLNVPQNLSFFREISITGAIAIFLMYIVVYFIEPTVIPEGQSVIFSSITQGITFGGGLIVMLQGVRLLINQIVPAFQGISEKLIEGAQPAFDVPLLFNYKPNAVILGFIIAMTTSTVAILLTNVFNIFGVILVPLVVTSFFEMGGAAVIAEGQGGLKGAIIGTISSSILMVVIMGVSVVVYNTTIRNWLLIFGGNDFSLFGSLAKYIGDILTLIF